MSLYYSKKELVLRIIWAFIRPLFFQTSPRLFYAWRNFILRLMGAKIGRNVKIFPSAHITFPWLLEVEDDVVVSWGVKIYNLGLTQIGRKTIISQHAHLCGGTHDINHVGFKLERTGLTIGRNVWIAADAFVGPRVHVGDFSIVAARAVVIRDVAPKTIVGGNPARVLKVVSDNFCTEK